MDNDRSEASPAGRPRPDGDGEPADRASAEPVDAAIKHVTKAGRRYRCPSCGSRSVGVILFGYPRPEVFESDDYRSGELVLGGCVIWPEMPELRCHACGHEWRRPAWERFDA